MEVGVGLSDFMRETGFGGCPLTPSPKLCSEHTKSDSSRCPDPDMFPYSLTSVSYIPFLPF